jgi:hypothetical protein
VSTLNAVNLDAPLTYAKFSEPRHAQMLAFFRQRGNLGYYTHRYAIVTRVLISGFSNSIQYGIGCLRCGVISWNAKDVANKTCPFCEAKH